MDVDLLFLSCSLTLFVKVHHHDSSTMLTKTQYLSKLEINSLPGLVPPIFFKIFALRYLPESTVDPAYLTPYSYSFPTLVISTDPSIIHSHWQQTKGIEKAHVLNSRHLLFSSTVPNPTLWSSIDNY